MDLDPLRSIFFGKDLDKCKDDNELYDACVKKGRRLMDTTLRDKIVALDTQRKTLEEHGMVNRAKTIRNQVIQLVKNYESREANPKPASVAELVRAQKARKKK